MSGGSYDYLYAKDIDELIVNQYQLKQMAEDLSLHWPSSQAAQDTHFILKLINTFEKLLNEFKKPLEEVWRAQEWWQSADYNKEEVTQTIWDYEHPKKKEDGGCNS